MSYDKVEQILDKAHLQSVRVLLVDDLLKIRVQRGVAVDPALLELIRNNKEDILHYLRQRSNDDLFSDASNGVIPRADTLPEKQPLSFGQQRLWFIDSLHGSLPYHLHWLFRLKGAPDAAVMEAAIRKVLDRHEPLRTVIREENGQGYQYLQPADEWRMGFVPGYALSPATGGWQEVARQEVRRPFDLAADFMLRVTLIQLEPDEYLLLAVIHHIAADGWSIPLIVKEWTELYNGMMQGRAPQLPELTIRYSDYTNWQRARVEGRELSQAVDYWKEKLTRYEANGLLTDKPRKTGVVSEGSQVDCHTDILVAERLGEVARQENVTVLMLLLAIFKILLFRYTGERDIRVGVPLSGRRRAELENLAGLFVNVLPLRTIVEKGMSLRDYLQEVKRTVLEAWEYEEIPYEKIVEVLTPRRDAGEGALFQVTFAYRKQDLSETIRLDGLSVNREELDHTMPVSELDLAITEGTDGLQIRLTYRSDLYCRETAETLLQQYVHLLEIAAAGVDGPLPRLRIDSPAMSVGPWKNANAGTTVPAAFCREAEINPGALAIVSGATGLTYAELDDRSDRLAFWLRNRGVKEETIVPVCLERGIEIIIAMLGIWKTGGAYTPVDPVLPEARIAAIVKDTRAEIIITRSIMQEVFRQEASPGTPAALVAPSPHHLAYVIYTSGSTGQPKGVCIEHRNLINLVDWHTREFRVGRGSRATAVAGVGFDAFGWEIWPYLASGGTVYLVNNETLLSEGGLAGVYSHNSITHSFCPTALLPRVLERLAQGVSSLQFLLTGGERLLPVDLSGLNFTLVNNYGPTENTVVATRYILTGKDNGFVPSIGKPISGVEMIVVDEELRAVPPGVPGELCIGGRQVARGYLNQVELTREKFCRLPETGGEIVYRTGDRVRLLADGNLEFLGRIDQQVKVRGYRIELGEIEHILRQAAGVKDAVVLVHDDDAGGARLAAFVVPENGFDRQEVMVFLRNRLPDYMIPATLQDIDAIPLTVNGKVDRRVLAERVVPFVRGENYVAPRDEREAGLAVLWRNILRSEPIGVYDDFFASGGHSLLAMQLASAIRRASSCPITVKDIFLYPTIAGIAGRIDELSQSSGRPRILPAIAAIPQIRGERIPLSFAQERLWFIDRLQGSLQYHMPWVFRLEGDLRPERFAEAVDALVQRHEVLRTVLVDYDGVASQQVLEVMPVLQITDACGVEAGALSLLIGEEISRPFRLDRERPVRIRLLPVGERQWLLVGVVHHIAFDGWSLPILVRELAELYRSACEQRPAALSPLPFQYADFARWQRRNLQGELLEQKLDYWKQQLAGWERLALPTDHPRGTGPGIRGDVVRGTLDAVSLEALNRLSATEGVTLFMTLLTVFKILLYRYTGQQDIVVGSPVAGRDQQELEGLIGFFVNTVVLRSRIRPEARLQELLQQEKQVTLAAYEHQDVPFEKIVEVLDIQRDTDRQPVIDVLFAFQNNPMAGVMPELDGVILTEESTLVMPPVTDIFLALSESPEGLQTELMYRGDLFDQDTMERMMGYYLQFLRTAAADAGVPVGRWKMLSSGEEWTLINVFSGVSLSFKTDETVLTRMASITRENPGMTALVAGEGSLTYSELWDKSELFARYLFSLGISREQLIPVCMERSLEMAVAILGIMKAGGVFVPLDPNFPRERIRLILEDSGSGILLVNNSSPVALPEGRDWRVIDMRSGWERGAEALSPVAIEPGDAELVYVIYTSGSTGKPKGVMIEHRSLMNFLSAVQGELRMTRGATLLSVTTFSFDIFYLELLLPLVTGGKVILADRETILNSDRLKNLLSLYRPGFMQAVPSFWQSLVDSGWQNEERVAMLVGGEALNEGLKDELLAIGNGRVWNLYGPTEATIWATVKALHAEEKVTIGRPMAGVRIYIMDEQLNLVPTGVTGEIYIGGVQVARGYWEQPELTAERFVKDPFAGEGRMYRTGDLGRWRRDGQIEYLGRRDGQVKIRGYRIELGEIEAVLGGMQEVGSSAVVVVGDDGSSRLAAFVTAGGEGGVDAEVLLEKLRQQLPEYMVPWRLEVVESLPLTPNGKTDRSALTALAVELSGGGGRMYAPPTNEIERLLVGVWQELLGIPSVGIHDNFFELGGHSLLAMRLSSQIRKQLVRDMPVRTLFLFPTIAGQARQILLAGSQDGAALPPVVAWPRVSGEAMPLSFAQERLWFIDRLQGSVQYHMPWVFRLEGDLRPERLGEAFDALVQRHEVLRSVVAEQQGRGMQQVLDVPPVLQITDASGVEAGALSLLIGEEISRPFGLDREGPIRVSLYVTGERQWLLIAVIHHIAFDGWSLPILVRELAELYRSACEQRPAALSPLPFQYGDYARWQRGYLQGELLEKKLGYWKQQLAGWERLELATDHPRRPEAGNRGGVVRGRLEGSLLEALDRLSATEGVTLFMTLLTVFKILLYRYTGQQDIVVGSPVAGRDQQELEGLIGFFVNTVVLRSHIRPEARLEELLQQEKQVTLAAYEHQDVPFEKIVEALGVERERGRQPFFDMLFSWQTALPSGGLDLGEVLLSQVDSGEQAAQFDGNVNLLETPTGLEMNIVYNCGLFRAETMQGLLDHYIVLLGEASGEAGRERPVGCWRMVDEGQQRQLLEWGRGPEVSGELIAVPLQVERMAAAEPEAIALVEADRQWSYGQLDAAANRVAHWLRSHGVGQEAPVPVCLERSAWQVIALLGCWKAGAAFVPIDPSYPAGRIGYMVEDSGAAVLLTTAAIAGSLRSAVTPGEGGVFLSGAGLLLIDVEQEDIDRQPGTRPDIDIGGRGLAYILYTSGSTGRPKGVMIEHQSLSGYIQNARRLYVGVGDDGGMDGRYGSYGHLSFSFDAAQTALWVPLTSGRSLVLGSGSGAEALSSETLYGRGGYDLLKVTPGQLALLGEQWRSRGCPGSKWITARLVVGGEALRRSQYDFLSRAVTGVRLYNEYGPTEATVGCCVYEEECGAAGEQTEEVPIGRPMAGVRIYIMDEQLNLVPTGVTGEIYIGGVQVARGYWEQPELTAERFVKDPFAGEGRMYRTGDLGRWRRDGQIEYLGRRDGQVKIRGYRIELGEIEAVLGGMQEVGSSAVVVVGDDGSSRLAAFVTAGGEGGVDAEVLLEKLRQQLPEYMVPWRLEVVESLPLTPNGKTDRSALTALAVELSGGGGRMYAPPTNEIERLLVGVWQELLGIPSVGIHDNFFELGGDSIIAIQVVSRLKREDISIPLQYLFTYQTIAKLAESIASTMGALAGAVATAEPLSGESILLPVQQWYFHKVHAAGRVFDQSVLLNISKELSADELSPLFSRLVDHHDALRFNYRQSGSVWIQEYDANQFQLEVTDLRAMPDNVLRSSIEAEVQSRRHQTRLEQGRLFRVLLILTPSGHRDNRLLIAVHHLLMDGVSWRILLEDLDRSIVSRAKGEEVLTRKGSSYREWGDAMKRYAGGARLLAQRNYWEQLVQKFRPLQNTRHQKESADPRGIRRHSGFLDVSWTRALMKEAPRAYHTEINDLLLAALSMTVGKYYPGNDVVIGLEGHGREEPGGAMDVSNTIGWFTTVHPFLLPVQKEVNERDIICRTKEALRRVPDKGLGYWVLRYLYTQPLPGMGEEKEPWDIQFNYLGRMDNAVRGASTFGLAEEMPGSTAEENVFAPTRLVINGMILNDRLVMDWNYDSALFDDAAISVISDTYLENLQKLITHCLSMGQGRYTPADFGLEGNVGYEELQALLERPVGDRPLGQLIETVRGLTSLQEGMLFHGLYDDSGAYIMHLSVDLIHLDKKKFIQAWECLLRRHSVLRMAFYADALAVPVQLAWKTVDMPVNELDLRGLPAVEQDRPCREFEMRLRSMRFDFQVPPLMRIGLVRLDDERYRMIWVWHHILLDGWSGPVLMKEFVRAYEGETLPGEDRFEDFVDFLRRRDRMQEEEYWREYLSRSRGNSLLPFIKDAERTRGNAGAYRDLPLEVEGAAAKRLYSYVQGHHITVNTLIQGVWAYLLYRYTGNESVLFGVAVSGRSEEIRDIENRVGMYINTLPAVIQLKEDQPVTDWLKDIQQREIASRRFQHVPLGDLRSWTGIREDIFDHVLVFENYPVGKILNAGHASLKAERITFYDQNNYPLTIAVTAEENIGIHFKYNLLLDEFYVDRMRGHFRNVLDQIVNGEVLRVGDIGLFTEQEAKEIMIEFNATEVRYPEGVNLVGMFQAQVEETPGAVALAWSNRQMTYEELDERSDRLGYYLRQAGITDGMIVPVCLERGADMIIALLAVLKAGGACLPLTPNAPVARIADILEDSGALFAITSAACRDLLRSGDQSIKCICADEVGDILPPVTQLNWKPLVTSADLAYVIYTSGSTGRPKGVMIEHSAVANLVYNQVLPLGLRQGLCVLQFAPFSFDAAFHEIFCTLLWGGRLVLCEEDVIKDPQAISSLLEYHGVDLVTLPPAYLSVLKEESLSAGTIISAGEALDPKLAAAIRRKGIQLINAYGPTENTVSSTLSINPVHPSGCVTIGRPNANVRVYLLDQLMRPVPMGVAGEMYIGGAQLARGYWRRPELTRDRFVTGTDVEKIGEKRLYRTGDLARWLPDGNLEYVGRNDYQVKIRGNRVELEEVESVLRSLAGISQAVVVAREDRDGGRDLAAYIVPDEECDRRAILSKLEQLLPDYMIPGWIIPLESMPLTANGKIDRKALSLREPESVSSERYAAPADGLQQQLAAIWVQLLEVDRVGIHDHFFDLGGHSLLAIRAISMIRKECGIALEIKDLFDHPTIAGLCVRIGELPSGDKNHLAAPVAAATRAPDDPMPLSFAQERLWFIDRVQGSVPYHLSWVFRLEGELQPERLSAAVDALVQRHEVLRTVLVEQDGHASQRVLDEQEDLLRIVDGVIAGDPSVLIEQEVSRPFRLDREGPIRVSLHVTGERQWLLIAVIHHIAFDGWSLPILVRELAELYRSACEQRPASLSPLPFQYGDYARWQRGYLQGELLEQKLGYWKQRLAGWERLAFPTDYPRLSGTGIRGGIVRERLDKAELRALAGLSAAGGATLFMLLLTVLKVLLSRYTGQEDILIGTPVAGRDQQELEGLIGFFVNTLVLRSRIRPEARLRELLQQEKEIALAAYQQQDVPFDKVVEALGGEREMNRQPMIDVMFALQNMPAAESLDLGGVTLTASELAPGQPKFDLQLDALETGSGLELELVYNESLYSRSKMENLLGHYKHLVRVCGSGTDLPIGRISLMGENEKARILAISSGLQPETKKEAMSGPFMKTFLRRVQENTVSTAIRYKGKELSYAALADRISRITGYLRGVKQIFPGDRVMILLGRSEELPVAILSLFYGGFVYVPAEIGYTEDRLMFMLQDVSPSLVIAEPSRVHWIKEKGFDVITLREIMDHTDRLEAEVYCDSENIAYILYTSGSTGAQKGVMASYGNLDHLFRHVCSSFGREGMILPFTAAHTFDISLFQILMPLLCGGVCEVVDTRQFGNLDELMPILRRATMIDTVPGIYRLWIDHIRERGFQDQFAGVERVFIGGDAIGEGLLYDVSGVFSSAVVTVLYGPTEGTLFCSSLSYQPGTVSPGTSGALIGRPLLGTRLYVMGAEGELLPPGFDGEIAIAGEGVTKGYWNLDEETSKRYGEDIHTGTGQLYWTGDIGRWTEEGMLEFRGRRDHQVKIRGNRIELDGIGARLKELDGIDEAVAVVVREEMKDGYLAVFYTGEVMTRDNLEAHLRRYLSAGLLPGWYEHLTRMPLTENGKIDRKSLSRMAQEATAQRTAVYEEARSEPEQFLTQLWQQLLGKERISIRDNFFELGGDSIMSIQMASRARNAGWELRPQDVFTQQTIAGLSRHIVRYGSSTSDIKTEQGLLSGVAGMLPVQLQFFSSPSGITSHFNQSVLLEVKPPVTAGDMKRAYRELVGHHDALRFRYTAGEQGWVQSYDVQVGELETADLTEESPESLPAAVTMICQQMHRGLDIGKGRLLRMVWMETAPSVSRPLLLVVIHHLAIDGVSWRILLEDLETLLSGLTRGRDVSLGPKGSSYRQWAEALERYSRSPVLQEQKKYWERIVKEFRPFIPAKRDREPRSKGRVLHYTSRLTAEQTSALLLEAPAIYHTDMNDLLLAALARTLGRWSGRKNITIGTEGHGRELIDEDVDHSRTLGWFTSLYPVSFELPDKDEPGAWIKNIKEQIRRIPQRGLGFGLFKYIIEDVGFEGRDPWDVLFNYLGQASHILNPDGLLKGSVFATGDNMDAETKPLDLLEINSVVIEDALEVNWTCRDSDYDERTLGGLAESYLDTLRIIGRHIRQQANHGEVLTPSDCGLGMEISVTELDEFLKEKAADGSGREASIERIYRLSGLQEGILFHILLDEHTGAYMHQTTVDLYGLREDVFVECWDRLVQRHSILRTAFYPDGLSIPVQCVHRTVECPIRIEDIRKLLPEEREPVIGKYRQTDRSDDFPLSEAPLMRIALFRLGDDHYKMVWTVHHLLLDGWSLPILMEEFLLLYDSLAGGEAIPVSGVDLFEDYIRYIGKVDGKAEENYWRGYLNGMERGCLLPVIRPENKMMLKGGYREEVLRPEPELALRAEAFARDHHITLNTLLQGVWTYLLYRYTGHEQVIFGVTVSGRPDDLPGVEKRVGMYINTLPLLQRIDEDETIAHLLRRLQDQQGRSRQFQYTPLSRIQTWTGVQGELFDTLFVYENYPLASIGTSPPGALRAENLRMLGQNTYALSVVVGQWGGLQISFRYNDQRIDGFFVRQIAGHFGHILEQFVADGDLPCGKTELLLPEEERLLVRGINVSSVDLPSAVTLPELIDQQCRRSPDAIALVFGQRSLSYRQLQQLSDRMSRFLQNKGVGEETPVLVSVKRSLAPLVAFLAISKAGGVYVPVDPLYPDDRIAFMLGDLGCRLCLADDSLLERAGAFDPATEFIDLPALLDELQQQADDDRAAVLRCRPGGLVYIIYTSGSTGRPKGVMIEHRHLLDHVYGMIAAARLDRCARFALIASLTADAGHSILFAALLTGGAVHVLDDSLLEDGEAMARYLSQQAIDCIKIVPSLWLSYSQSGAMLLPGKVLVFGGETLGAAIAEQLVGAGYVGQVFNHYGPTEATIGKCMHAVELGRPYSTVPIGRPFSNTQLYVADTRGRLCPMGVPGELFIGGLGIARGYVGAPQLTAGRFLINRWDATAGGRVYRTGDRVRWTADGQIEYLGRMDDQLKIRGYRIEPGEIEAVLQQTPGVQQAVVTAVQDANGQATLVAYLVTAPGFDRQKTLLLAQTRLPEPMIPRMLIPIPAVPLTPIGKIDKSKLPRWDAAVHGGDDYEAPQSPLELLLAEIWEEILRVERIGLRDNFFELGGNSLSIMRMSSFIRKKLQLTIPIRVLFQFPRIVDLAGYIELEQSSGNRDANKTSFEVMNI